MFKRNCKNNILDAIKDTPVVLICGARQVGKSTLVKEIIHDSTNANYFTMDDLSTLAAASSNPTGFISDIKGTIVIDEVQRVPELFLVIKKIVDANRMPGKFLLTGSANVLTIPKLSDSLAGRMEIINMCPLSQGEIEGAKETFLNKCFDKSSFSNSYECDFYDITKRIVNGGYPEVLNRVSAKRKSIWFESYIKSIIQRDIRDLSGIEGIRELPHLLSILVTRVGSLTNLADISRLSKIPWSTLKRYLTLLENIYMISFVPSWYRNYEKRIVKAPKIYFCDTGLLCHLYGINDINLIKRNTLTGHVFENFVYQEIFKQSTWNDEIYKICCFRTQGGKEVDLVLERQDGCLIGIEVKLSSDVSTSDFDGLQELKNVSKDKFINGYVLYTGNKTISFGGDMMALPIPALWQS